METKTEIPDLAKQQMKTGSGWTKFYAITIIIFSLIGLISSFFIFSTPNQQARISGLLLLFFCILFLWAHILLLQHGNALSKSRSGEIKFLLLSFKKQQHYFIVIACISLITLLYKLYNFISII